MEQAEPLNRKFRLALPKTRRSLFMQLRHTKRSIHQLIASIPVPSRSSRVDELR